MDGYKTLKAGQQVSFETAGGAKGTHEIEVRLAVSEEELTWMTIWIEVLTEQTYTIQ